MFSDYASFYSSDTLEAIIDTEQLPTSDKIRQISSVFIDVPYAANRMIGDQNTDEQLVIKLGELDCFTYLDYVEALRKSEQLDDFKDNLIQTRYINDEVDFKARRHFFSDWVNEEAYNAIDITLNYLTFKSGPKISTKRKWGPVSGWLTHKGATSPTYPVQGG